MSKTFRVLCVCKYKNTKKKTPNVQTKQAYYFGVFAIFSITFMHLLSFFSFFPSRFQEELVLCLTKKMESY